MEATVYVFLALVVGTIMGLAYNASGYGWRMLLASLLLNVPAFWFLADAIGGGNPNHRSIFLFSAVVMIVAHVLAAVLLWRRPPSSRS